MANYVILMSWTEQGIATFADSPSRAEAGRGEMEKLGVQLKDIHWTVGPYDLVLVVDAPNDEALAAALLRLGSAGNVRTTTMRAFTRDEFEAVVAKIG